MSDPLARFLATVDPVKVAGEWTTTTLVEARAEGFQRVKHKRMVEAQSLRKAKREQTVHSKRAQHRLWELVDNMNQPTARKQAMRSAATRRAEKKIAQARAETIANIWLNNRKGNK